MTLRVGLNFLFCLGLWTGCFAFDLCSFGTGFRFVVVGGWWVFAVVLVLVCFVGRFGLGGFGFLVVLCCGGCVFYGLLW